MIPSPELGPDLVSPQGTWVLPPLPLPFPPSSSTSGLFLALGWGWLPPPRPGFPLLQSHMLSPALCLSFPTEAQAAPRHLQPLVAHGGHARSHRFPKATVSPLSQIHPAPNPAPSSAAALPGLMRLSRRVGLHREKPGISHGASARRCHSHGQPR